MTSRQQLDSIALPAMHGRRQPCFPPIATLELIARQAPFALPQDEGGRHGLRIRCDVEGLKRSSQGDRLDGGRLRSSRCGGDLIRGRREHGRRARIGRHLLNFGRPWLVGSASSLLRDWRCLSRDSFAQGRQDPPGRRSGRYSVWVRQYGWLRSFAEAWPEDARLIVRRRGQRRIILRRCGRDRRCSADFADLDSERLGRAADHDPAVPGRAARCQTGRSWTVDAKRLDTMYNIGNLCQCLP